jgi:hypothetical protein
MKIDSFFPFNNVTILKLVTYGMESRRLNGKVSLWNCEKFLYRTWPFVLEEKRGRSSNLAMDFLDS